MATTLNLCVRIYTFLLHDLADPRVYTWPLMKNPYIILGILLLYFYLVFNLGPKLMENRRPFNLEKVLVVYNALQIVACLHLIQLCTRYTLFNYNIFCEAVDYANEGLPLLVAENVWKYFMLKVFDLLDTIFFVLRKRNRQVTFLHVYHHAGMCALGWLGTKYLAGGHSVFLGFLNCIVHVVMYFYYLLSAWDKEYKKSVWWKKHITQLQIAQFVILLVHFSQLVLQPNCGYPRWILLFLIPQNIFMIVLFTDFYVKNYRNPATTVITASINGTSNGNSLSKEKVKET